MNKIILIVIIILAVLGIIYFIATRDETVGSASLTETAETEEPAADESTEPTEPITDEPEEIIAEKEVAEIGDDFLACLEDAGVVIYGSSTCPACAQLEEEWGGKEVVDPIYLDCSGLGTTEETERCMEGIKTGYVPEIQIKGELFEGWGSPQALAEATGCQL